MSGWIRVLVAILVAIGTLAAKMVFWFIPRRIMSELDWERSKKFLPDVRLFRGFRDEAEVVTIDYNAPQLIRHHGYPCEEHTIYTDDGYVLTYHRIPYGKNDKKGEGAPRPPVFIMHGLMQCSEAWVCDDNSLAFTMADDGFDVWLGNNRGNKYGFKHTHLKPSSSAFWNFCIDEYARFDVPAGINYILRHTGFKTLTYVGFSQGSAQAFACFSTQHHISSKVNLFIALSPAAKAQGLTRGFLSTFVKIAPQAVFLLFGTHMMWSSVFFYRSILTRKFFTESIDTCCSAMFAWNMSKLGDLKRKMKMYPHLYSYTSVKTVVHWFQIVAHDSFQQYDDNDSLLKNSYEDVASNRYPIEQIQCPVAVFYGSADFLTDIPWIIKNVPEGSVIRRIEDYEHIDMMWAVDAPKLVFGDVVQLAKTATESKNKRISGISGMHILDTSY